MKRRLVVSLVGLAIGFALPTYAQEKDLADPQTTQKILAVVKGFDEAHNNNDAAAVAALLHARRGFCYARGARSSVGKPLRNGIQTCTSGGTPKTASPRSTGMPFT